MTCLITNWHHGEICWATNQVSWNNFPGSKIFFLSLKPAVTPLKKKKTDIWPHMNRYIKYRDINLYMHGRKQHTLYTVYIFCLMQDWFMEYESGWAISLESIHHFKNGTAVTKVTGFRFGKWDQSETYRANLPPRTLFSAQWSRSSKLQRTRPTPGCCLCKDKTGHLC